MSGRDEFRWRVQVLLLVLALTDAAAAQITECVSVSSAGDEGDGQSGYSDPAISGDGRFIAFPSFASDLVPADTNMAWDVFVHDRLSGQTIRGSVTSAGGQADGDSGFLGYPETIGVDISVDGRWLAFMSAATDIVPFDGNGTVDVFVRDLALGQNWRVSVTSSGGEAHGNSVWPSISHDGRFVAFASEAPDLVPLDGNGTSDIFVHDRQLGTTQRVSVSSAGVEGSLASIYPVISPDGGLVGFSSYAPELVPLDGNGTLDAFVRVLASGVTMRVSVDAAGLEGPGESAMGDLSFDGRYVGFSSSSALVPEDGNGFWDDYVRDLVAGSIERVSVGTGGVEGNESSYGLSLSGDGRYAAFSGYAGNLVPGDHNHTQDVFLHDRLTGATTRASSSLEGLAGNGESAYPDLSLDGRVVAFNSYANDLVEADGNLALDVFVHGRFVLSLDGTPAAGQPLAFEMMQIAPGQVGKPASVLVSCTGVGGIGLAGGSVVWLTADACTALAATSLAAFTGIADGSGTAQTPVMTFPQLPPGLPYFAAAVTWDAATGSVLSVADPIVFVSE